MLVFWLLCIITCLLGMSLSNRAVSDIPYGAKFDGRNIDEFDNYLAIRQYFPHQNFLFS